VQFWVSSVGRLISLPNKWMNGSGNTSIRLFRSASIGFLQIGHLLPTIYISVLSLSSSCNLGYAMSLQLASGPARRVGPDRAGPGKDGDLRGQNQNSKGFHLSCPPGSHSFTIGDFPLKTGMLLPDRSRIRSSRTVWVTFLRSCVGWQVPKCTKWLQNPKLEKIFLSTSIFEAIPDMA